ncbi:MAG: hypothetical protein COB66_00665 [Coxiella sp. (in: Bacteria)]|nr:MAG: hypothetical protein COB66_00665 [Coxiella sp. (in: g-proteobacteria)]
MMKWQKRVYGQYTKYFMGRYLGKYLTQREAEILCYFRDMKYAEIALIFNLSVRTVEAYSMNLQVKLGCNSKKEVLQLICEKDIEVLRELIEIDKFSTL